MVENQSNHQNVPSLDWTNEASSRTIGLKKKKNNPAYPSSVEDEVSSDNHNQIECSGQNCKSCTATVVADCVAICCCPCAVVNFLTLTLVKVPFTMGRRCLRLMKKKCPMLGKKERRKRNDKADTGVIERSIISVQNCNKEGSLASLEGNLEIPIGSVVNGPENFCARVEAERVWLELYQVGHLGFGRVSFTGIPAKGS
ncbi:hypothetical protein BVC80_9043g46 [Macleaya cordata]|uniref:Uncharacterized protein n=1 Tax=Macleaya cordata TaxID=56857 RepID=A0A200R2P9_MACCD|nr:hypothetical protein BVC80_9043g46 [Macleaya cordata]